jgi:hypothetical protein
VSGNIGFGDTQLIYGAPVPMADRLNSSKMPKKTYSYIEHRDHNRSSPSRHRNDYADAENTVNIQGITGVAKLSIVTTLAIGIPIIMIRSHSELIDLSVVC